MEGKWIMCGLCLLAGVAFGISGRAARALVRAGKAPGTAQPGRSFWAALLLEDLFKTVLACALCTMLLAPELEEAAALYGGAGVLLGHMGAERKQDGRTAIIVCVWVVLCLPVTGAVCLLAGLTVALGTGRFGWGAALVPALAVPVAWLQFGVQSSLFMLAAFLLLLCGQRRTAPARAEGIPLPPQKNK